MPDHLFAIASIPGAEHPMIDVTAFRSVRGPQMVEIGRPVPGCNGISDLLRPCPLGSIRPSLAVHLVEPLDRVAETISGEGFIRAHPAVIGNLEDLDGLMLVRADVPSAAGVSARTGAPPVEAEPLAERRQLLEVVAWITRSEQALD